MAAIRFEQGEVRGFVHEPDRHVRATLVLTHGAGGNCQARLLLAAADAFCAAGYRVLRCDLPFRQRRPFGPPMPKSAEQDRAGLREAVAAMRALDGGAVYLGGHSYGGRQATILAAEEPTICQALLLLSYPLHPPKKPGELRTGHFPNLRTPALFVSGTKDPFGSVEEMTEALKLVRARVEFVTVEGAGHDLQTRKVDVGQFLLGEFERFVSRA